MDVQSSTSRESRARATVFFQEFARSASIIAAFVVSIESAKMELFRPSLSDNVLKQRKANERFEPVSKRSD
jgi:hypothetical protein